MIAFKAITKRDDSGWIPGAFIVFPGILGVLSIPRFEADEHFENRKDAIERGHQLKAKLIEELALDYCHLVRNSPVRSIMAAQ
jgi:hypothetical protein